MNEDLDKKARKLWIKYSLYSEKKNTIQLNSFWKQYTNAIQQSRDINSTQVEQNQFVLIDIAQAYQELPQKHYVLHEKKAESGFNSVKFIYNFLKSVASIVTFAAIVSIPVSLATYSLTGSASAIKAFWICSGIAFSFFTIININKWFKDFINTKNPQPQYKLPKKQYTLVFMPDHCTLDNTKIYYRSITQVSLIPVQNQLHIIENPVTLPKKIFRLPLYDSENQLLDEVQINALYDFFQAVVDYNKIKNWKKFKF